MNRAFRIIAFSIIAILTLAACALGLNRIVYGRSLKATLYEYKLRRQFATDRTAEAEIQRLESKRTEAEPVAALPDNLGVPAEEATATACRCSR